jgi:hypothetical protein
MVLELITLTLAVLILNLFLVGLFVNFNLDDFVVWIQSEWILILMITGSWICFFGAQRFIKLRD